MKVLLNLFLLVMGVSCASAGNSYITLVPLGPHPEDRSIDPVILDLKTDPLNLYINEDGSLGCEGEQVSLQWLEGWIKKTKKYEHPMVALGLSAKISSNSNLPKIKKILDFLIARHALYGVTIVP